MQSFIDIKEKNGKNQLSKLRKSIYSRAVEFYNHQYLVQSLIDIEENNGQNDN